MRFHISLILAFSVTRCGVEAGNSGGGKPKTGNVSIFFAQEAVNGSESFSVQLSSLDLLTADDSSSASVSPSVESVDLFGLSEGDTVLAGESAAVPVGSYQQIAIRLSGDRPVRYRDKDGQDISVDLADSTAASFYVEQSFEIVEGETTSIVVSLDPYRSLEEREGEERFVFKPRGDARPPEEGVRYQGSTAIADAEWVCAYAYALEGPPPPPPLGLPPPPGGFGPGGIPPPRGPRVEDRLVFASKAEIVKDETDACPNAFAKAPVIDGNFEFRHLRPASYELRVFTYAGTFEDVPDDISLPPPERGLWKTGPASDWNDGPRKPK